MLSVSSQRAIHLLPNLDLVDQSLISNSHAQDTTLIMDKSILKINYYRVIAFELELVVICKDVSSFLGNVGSYSQVINIGSDTFILIAIVA